MLLVLALHAAALWAMQWAAHGAAPRRSAQVALSVRLLDAPAMVESTPPQPDDLPVAAPATPPPPKPQPRPVAQPQPVPPPQPERPQPVLAISPAASAADAPADAPAPANTPTAGVSAGAVDAKSRIDDVVVQLPTERATHLHNPLAYPPISQRLGEEGKVLIRALIGVDGRASELSVETSSGFERLDRAALAAVADWRFVPGRRGGVPEAMWYRVPVEFKIKQR